MQYIVLNNKKICETSSKPYLVKEKNIMLLYEVLYSADKKRKQQEKSF
jgi:hypothetical protein